MVESYSWIHKNGITTEITALIAKANGENRCPFLQVNNNLMIYMVNVRILMLVADLEYI